MRSRWSLAAGIMPAGTGNRVTKARGGWLWVAFLLDVSYKHFKALLKTCFDKATALCEILYKRLRNILSYVLSVSTLSVTSIDKVRPTVGIRRCCYRQRCFTNSQLTTTSWTTHSRRRPVSGNFCVKMWDECNCSNTHTKEIPSSSGIIHNDKVENTQEYRANIKLDNGSLPENL